MSLALELLLLGGGVAGALVGQLKPVRNFIAQRCKNPKNVAMLSTLIPAGIGGIAGTIASFPLQAWGAKAEVSASREGRFEAMRKELNNPNSFAILTDEQIEEAKKKNLKIIETDIKDIIKIDNETFEYKGIIFKHNLIGDFNLNNVLSRDF